MTCLQNPTRQSSPRGFTIVELLIVIVVIAILAAISIAAYNGIKNRSEDVKIRSVAKQFTKAFQQWSIQSAKRTVPGGAGSTAFSNGVCVSGGGGWLTRTTYACTIDTILVNEGLIPSDLVLSVPNTQTARPGAYSTLMLYGCPTVSGNTTQYAMMYALHTPDNNEISNVQNECNGGNSWYPFGTYGMNGGYVFTLSQ